MDKIKKSQIIKWAKFIAPLLIPVIGVIFLEWGIFEIAFTYLIETAVIFTIFSLDYYLINKRSRYPFAYGFILMFFYLFPFIGIIYAWSLLTFSITQPNIERFKTVPEAFNRYIQNSDFIWVVIALIIFEAIHYLLKNFQNRNHKSSSVWYNLKKLLVIQAFVIINTFIFSFLPHNNITAFLFIIGFKLTFDFVIDNDKVMAKIERVLSKFATLGLNDDGTVRHEKDD